MTLEEKRDAIKKRCMSRLGKIGCDDCIMKSFLQPGENCYSETDDPMTDAKVERNYRILFGNTEKHQYFDELLKIAGKEAVEHFCLCSALWYLMDEKPGPAQQYMMKYLELVQVQDRVQDV